MNRHKMRYIHVFIKVLDSHGQVGVRKSNFHPLELKKRKEKYSPGKEGI